MDRSMQIRQFKEKINKGKVEEEIKKWMEISERTYSVFSPGK